MTLDDAMDQFLASAERLVAACDEIRDAGESAAENYEMFCSELEQADPKLDALRQALSEFRKSKQWDITLIDLIASSARELSESLDGLINTAEELAETLDVVEMSDVEDEEPVAA
jgi:prefoldin subunit 5